MPRADWTYQVAPAGRDAVGLEEYMVESASGARIGKVTTLLRRNGDLYLAVERGSPPATHDLRAYPWRQIEHVDHSALTVRLRLAEDELDQALELDPDKGVEQGEAEAARVRELPRDLARPSSPEAGPVDRPSYALMIALGMLGLLALLVLMIAALAVDFTWQFALFVVPALLFAAAGIAGYRLLRNPYARLGR